MAICAVVREDEILKSVPISMVAPGTVDEKHPLGDSLAKRGIYADWIFIKVDDGKYGAGTGDILRDEVQKRIVQNGLSGGRLAEAVTLLRGCYSDVEIVNNGQYKAPHSNTQIRQQIMARR